MTRRIRNDRLLMFCLRMNARDERGQRLSANYFRSGPAHPASVTTQALTRAEKDDMNAAMVEHFDPVGMSLEEIEAMQAQLAEIARRKRAEEDGPVDAMDGPAFFQLEHGRDWKAAGELEDLVEIADELEEWNEDEDHWRDNPGED